jgi:cyclase
MRYFRIIPVLLFDDGSIYRTQQFTRHYRLGDAVQQLERYKAWDVDEIVYLDMHRTPGGRPVLDFLPAIARNCFAPLAVGGAIRSLADIHRHLEAGADRVVINSAAIDNPTFISDAAHRYGAQAVIVSIDAARRADGYEVMADCGTRPTGMDAESWASQVADRDAGEIFLNLVDRDGMGTGYDIELIRCVTACVHVPVIACGGVGTFEHFAPALTEGGASSVAAANIFCFKELSYAQAKDALLNGGVAVRPSELISKKRPMRSPASVFSS